MSAIDRAFVRAYTKDQSPHTTNDKGALAVHSHRATVVSEGADGGYTLLHDGPHAAVPAPHIELDATEGDPSHQTK